MAGRSTVHVPPRRGAPRRVVVDDGIALVDGSLVTLHAPAPLGADPYAAAIHAVWREAAQDARPVRVVAQDPAGRTHLLVHPDGSVTVTRSPALKRGLLVAAASVLVLGLSGGLALAVGGSSGGPDRSDVPPTLAAAPTTSATPSPAPSPTSPTTAPVTPMLVETPAPPRRTKVTATPGPGELLVVVQSTRRPVKALVQVIRPSGEVVERTVRLTTFSTEIRFDLRAGPHQWRVLVPGTTPVEGLARIPRRPPPPEPEPQPQPQPAEPTTPDDPPSSTPDPPAPPPPPPPAPDPPPPHHGGGGPTAPPDDGGPPPTPLG